MPTARRSARSGCRRITRRACSRRSACVAALLAREASGRGQLVDVSLQAAVAASLEHVPGYFHQDGRVPHRQGTLHWTRFFRVGRCRDGWVHALHARRLDVALRVGDGRRLRRRSRRARDGERRPTASSTPSASSTCSTLGGTLHRRRAVRGRAAPPPAVRRGARARGAARRSAPGGSRLLRADRAPALGVHDALSRARRSGMGDRRGASTRAAAIGEHDAAVRREWLGR